MCVLVRPTRGGGFLTLLTHLRDASAWPLVTSPPYHQGSMSGEQQPTKIVRMQNRKKKNALYLESRSTNTLDRTHRPLNLFFNAVQFIGTVSMFFFYAWSCLIGIVVFCVWTLKECSHGPNVCILQQCHLVASDASYMQFIILIIKTVFFS